MKAHRSLQRLDVLKYPPEKIALMVASEFLRASARSEYPSIVQGCFDRARELMGILDTVDLGPEVASDLQPVYHRCTEEQLLGAKHLPALVREMSLALAQAFERASERLQKPPDA